MRSPFPPTATIRQFDDPNDLDEAAYEFFLNAYREAVAERGRFLVALSGGSTPVRLYAKLRGAPIDWNQVHVFWSDERFVPPTVPESNEGIARKALLDHVPVPKDHVHGLYLEGSPEAAALAYESLIREGPAIDLVLLGMGADGHTASLFPGDNSLGERTKWVVASGAPVGVRQRLTFTLPAIAAARRVLVLIAGADKRDAWNRVLAGEDLPVSEAIKTALRPEVLLCLE